MTTYLIHAGTGTIIDANDGVFILDSETLTPEQTAILENADDPEVIDLAVSSGQMFRYTDLSYTNSIAYSPASIREEVRESLRYKMSDDDKEMLDWAETTASADNLETIAQYILSGDALWADYQEHLIDGLRWGFDSMKKGTL